MFVSFFQELKQAGVPVTLREYLTLMEAMDADLASRRVDDFYFLSRAALVKDERNLDKFVACSLTSSKDWKRLTMRLRRTFRPNG